MKRAGRPIAIYCNAQVEPTIKALPHQPQSAWKLRICSCKRQDRVTFYHGQDVEIGQQTYQNKDYPSSQIGKYGFASNADKIINCVKMPSLHWCLLYLNTLCFYAHPPPCIFFCCIIPALIPHYKRSPMERVTEIVFFSC